jgi:hypothetical protein
MLLIKTNLGKKKKGGAEHEGKQIWVKILMVEGQR